MKNKKLIWLGLGAVALYLYFRNKPKANAVTPNVAPLPSPAPTPKITPNPVKPRPQNVPVLIPDKGDDSSNPYLQMSCTDLKNMREKEKTYRYITDPCRQNPKECEQKYAAYEKCGLITRLRPV